MPARWSWASSQLRRDGRCRIRRGPHADDLEIDQIVPVGSPLSETCLAVRFHHLKAALEVLIHPARNVPQRVRRHSSSLSEPTVHVGRLPRTEVLDHHEEHRTPIHQQPDTAYEPICNQLPYPITSSPNYPIQLSLPRMVLPLFVRLDLRAIEVHLAQIARAVADGLIAEVRRLRIAALSAGGYGSRLHLIAELDDRDEAVAAGAVHFLRPFVGACAERRQRQ